MFRQRTPDLQPPPVLGVSNVAVVHQDGGMLRVAADVTVVSAAPIRDVHFGVERRVPPRRYVGRHARGRQHYRKPVPAALMLLYAGDSDVRGTTILELRPGEMQRIVARYRVRPGRPAPEGVAGPETRALASLTATSGGAPVGMTGNNLWVEPSL